MPTFTKTHAEKFAGKLIWKPKDKKLPRLEVKTQTDGAHVQQLIWCDGKLIAQFGIKHGSDRNASHGWVARDLGLRPRYAFDFANCQISIDQMIKLFQSLGFIEVEVAIPDQENTDMDVGSAPKTDVEQIVALLQDAQDAPGETDD